MEEDTGYSKDEYDIDTVDATDNSSINDDDYNSANESWSSYNNLPSEDFQNNEDDTCSENEDVDVENAKNNKDDSFYDSVNQEDINDCIDDDGEVEIDIAETEKLKKMLDTHCKVMEMTFKSQGDAYMFYNNHAKERGFGIMKEKVKRGKGPAGIIRYER
ncbi:hypothetical protein D1007_39974 [Hordeum vulgare]|nr:hypothetical protein D1007_39974 [Hordeum vulgare]